MTKRTTTPPKPNLRNRDSKITVSIMMTPALLGRIDQAALEMGQSRSAIVSLGVWKFLEAEAPRAKKAAA